MKNSDLSNTYFEYCKDFFPSFIDKLSESLAINNSHYKSIMIKNSKILEKYPNIRKIIEDERTEISKKESKYLTEYFNSYSDLFYLMLEEMYFMGFKEAYYYFKRSGLISKRENDNRKNIE